CESDSGGRYRPFAGAETNAGSSTWSRWTTEPALASAYATDTAWSLAGERSVGQTMDGYDGPNVDSCHGTGNNPRSPLLPSQRWADRIGTASATPRTPRVRRRAGETPGA